MSQNTLLVSRRIQLWLAGLIVFTLWVFWTLLPSVGIGLTVAVVVHPFYRRLYRFFQVSEKSARSETIFSTIITVGIALLCLMLLALPFWIIIGNIDEIQAGTSQLMERVTVFEQDVAHQWGVHFDWGAIEPKVRAGLQDFAWSSVRSLPGALLGFFVFSMTLYLGIRYGAGVYRRALFVIELQTREILQRMATTIYKTLYAIYIVHFTTVVVTFVLAIPLFIMLGYSNILLWATIAAIFQLIPFIGPSLIMVGLIAWEVVVHDPVSVENVAVLILYGYLIVCIMPDWLLRPWLMGKQAGINPLVMWLGFFGGIAIMGPEGFVFGPLLLAVLIEAINIVLERFPDPLLQMQRETGRRVVRPDADTEDIERLFREWQSEQEREVANGEAPRPSATVVRRAAEVMKSELEQRRRERTDDEGGISTGRDSGSDGGGNADAEGEGGGKKADSD